MVVRPAKDIAAGSATSLVLSRDPAVVDLIRRSCPHAWRTEVCESWSTVVGATRERHSVRIVVFDDDAVGDVGEVGENERRQRIEEIHARFPEAFVIYVAGTHTAAIERSARMGGLLCYTSKPIDAERLESVLSRLYHAKPAAGSYQRIARRRSRGAQCRPRRVTDLTV